MDDVTLANNPYFSQVRAECHYCGKIVKVYVKWVAILNFKLAVIYMVDHWPAKPEMRMKRSGNCLGSRWRPRKYVTIPCPQCRSVGKSRNVPTSGLAYKHMLCAKHERMRQREEKRKK